jgi:hypothetical protein
MAAVELSASRLTDRVSFKYWATIWVLAKLRLLTSSVAPALDAPLDLRSPSCDWVARRLPFPTL